MAYLTIYRSCFVVFFLFFSLQTTAQPRNLSALQIKAVYLYRFSSFIQWPDTTFEKADSPFLICIAGTDPLQRALETTVSGEFYQGDHAFNVIYFEIGDEVSDCQVLYLSETLSEIMERDLLMTLTTTTQPILTVSGRSGFSKRGGMIEFYRFDNKVRFVIDPQRVREVGLQISAKLLRVADVVGQ